MPPEAPKPTDEQLLPTGTSDYQVAEKTRVESSQTLLDEINAPDNYSKHQGGTSLLGRAAELANKNCGGLLPDVQLVDEDTAEKTSIRILDTSSNRSQVVRPDGVVLTTMPAPDNRTIEFNPKGKPGEQYTEIKAGPPEQRVTVPEASIKDIPVATRTGEPPASEQVQTFADGRVVTTFPNARPGERESLTNYPPIKDGDRVLSTRPLQTETFKANPDGSSPERRAGRTVSRFEDRTETTFTPASANAADQLRISKVTAFNPKPGDPQGRALITEYAGNGRPEDGASRVTRFRADQPQGIREQAKIPTRPPAEAGKETKTKFADNSTESTFDPPRNGINKRLDIPGPPQKMTQEFNVNGDVTTTLEPKIVKSGLDVNGTVQNVEISKLTRKADGTYLINNSTTPVRISERVPGAAPNAPPDYARPITLGATERTGQILANGERQRGRTSDNTPPVPSDNPTPLPTTDRVQLNPNSSMPDRANIGNTSYRPTFADGGNGRLNELVIKPGNGPEVKLTRDGGPPPGFKVEPAGSLKDGQGRPVQNGEAVLDGFRVQVKDGRIVGDFHVNKRGEVCYKNGDGPDRIEQIKKADGSLVMIDMKNYERTEFGPPPQNQERSKKFWDGFEWRAGEKRVEGGKTIVEFTPKPGQEGFNPNKPATLERNGTPPNDTASVKFKDASGKETKSISADWTTRTQTEVVPGNPGPPPTPATTITRMDAGGGNYREIEGQPVRNGDNVTVKFKPGRDNEPISATYNTKDRTVSTEYKDSRVLRDANGRVTEVQQPKGTPSQRFAYDADGDLREHVTLNPNGTVKEKLIRQGPEKAPMMGAPLAAGPQETIGQPGRPALPRKIGEPTGFNTWRREPAPNPVTAENPATVQQNIFVTGDGAIIREKPPAPGSTAKADVSIEHPGRGTTETTRGGQREFKGPDGQTWTSTDGQRWRMPGMQRDLVGTPRSLADGTTVIRSTKPETIPGSNPPQTRDVVVDSRRNDDPASASVSELNEAGKEVRRIFDNGSVVTFDAQGNPSSRTIPGRPPTVQNFKFENGKCIEISDPSKNPAVTHKLEGGALRPVGKPTDPIVDVTREGRVLAQTTNPPNGTVEQLGNNTGLVRDQAGLPVRLERQNNGQTESWKIESHKEGNKLVIDKITDEKPPGRVIADKASGAIRLDSFGRATQESRPGSGTFDRTTSLDGRVDSPQARVRTNDKFTLNVDATKNEGTLTTKPEGAEWKLAYKPNSAGRGDVRELTKVTVPGVPGRTPADPATEFEVGKGTPPVRAIVIDENTGAITVDRGASATLFNPADPNKHRTEISKDGSAVTFNRDGIRTALTDQQGREFKITEVRVPAAPPAPATTQINSIEGPGGNPKLERAQGEISIDETTNTIKQQLKPNSEVVINPDGRTVTTKFEVDAPTKKTEVTTEQGNRRTVVDGTGKIKEIATRGADNVYRPWVFEPAGAEKNLSFGPPPANEVKLPDTITKVKLPDGTEVAGGAGVELYLRSDGTIARRHSITEGGKQFQETVHNGDGTRSEVFVAGHGTPDAIQWRVNMTGNNITSFRLPDQIRDVPVTGSLTAAMTNGELVLSVNGQPRNAVSANGKVFALGPGGERKEMQRRR